MSLIREQLCLGDIRVLRFLCASDKEENQEVSDLVHVDPVARSIIDAQLADTLADRLYVPEVAKRKAANPDLDASPRLFVAKLAQPVCKEVSLADLEHALTIVHAEVLFKCVWMACREDIKASANASVPGTRS